MSISISGDKEFENIPSIKSKALRINLNENIYGSFAEIGAGQETVRNFFKAGGASGTIAKQCLLMIKILVTRSMVSKKTIDMLQSPV